MEKTGAVGSSRPIDKAVNQVGLIASSSAQPKAAPEGDAHEASWSFSMPAAGG